MAARLRASVRPAADVSVIVFFHDREATTPYGICTLDGDPLTSAAIDDADVADVLAPMRDADRDYLRRDRTPPNLYIAFDLVHQHVWYGRSLKTVQKHSGSRLDMETLVRVPDPSTGEPPRLAPQAQLFTPDQVPRLTAAIATGEDRPEESFLLDEEFLHLAVDSLVDAELLEPLPVHINALWVFSRPIIMQRPDHSDRHVRAVWFRQGATLWRMRTYTAGVGAGMRVRQVGAQLAGRVPFVPVWDDTRPEQKLLAAVWALMAQGGVAESERIGLGGAVINGIPERSGDLTVVRVKAGTDHATVYRREGAGERSDRAAWSVRGHWRRQPYPSLGLDEDGNVRTRPIWIASYTKGSREAPVEPKVITVHP